ncbi:ATPase family associated with various cellular activities (AAA) [Mesorhizobium qingshengii]|uniref:ATPase family associated with various cellular activities (AAA) n=2 Tax=Mesorhizobium qingshengii TaxID=1165689 RepID=A0A1G5XG95_9HYPH|nr:ATPase family associated with various cellular activities (AAA) [Mesorhizobium qingshengii]
MVAAAIAATGPVPSQRFANGYSWLRSSRHPEFGVPDKDRKRVADARKMLLDAWRLNASTTSSTYGKDDILTLSWHLDLFSSDIDAQDVVEAIHEKILERCKRLAKYESLTNFRDALNAGFADDRDCGTSAYVLLRFVRCERQLPKDREVGVRTEFRKRAHDSFLNGLRDHLSFADGSDSRFDPCELAFCLEGLLHIRPDAVDDAMASRVFTLIYQAQEHSAGWRPQTPLTTSHRGEVLYPIGVETGTSVLCSLSLLDKRTVKRRSAALGHTHFRLIEKYWHWLRPRRVMLALPKGRELAGWRSERLGGQVLHIWENSQILEFLLLFHDYLKRHIAGELLELSELDVYPPEVSGSWEEIEQKFEPIKEADAPKFYQEIGQKFVQPRLEGSKSGLWSMLLYGPPGTGKTTTAKNVANALSLPLIRVTVSDFLADGNFRMERRAKLLFEVLRRQLMSVVLFDELDQLVLDRDSEMFRTADSVFQLLTPGMLTKIADLHDSKSVIFILATNYEDRIDSAIKRSGRVDVLYLCLQPDLARRKEVIAQTLKAFGAPANGRHLELAARNSVFLSHSDIKRVCGLVKQCTPDLCELLDREPRDIQFPAYLERYKAKSSAQGLQRELKGLARLAAESMVPGNVGQPRFVARFGQLVKELEDAGATFFGDYPGDGLEEGQLNKLKKVSRSSE